MEAHCSLTDVTNLVQQGAAGTYSTHDLMQLSFEATETTAGDRYGYLAEIKGATATTVSVSRTLLNKAPTATLGSVSGPDASGNYTVIAALSESSTDFTADSMTLTNATATVSGSGGSYTIVLTPIADGAVSMSIQRGAFTDGEGLENWVPSNELRFEADITAPTVSIAAFTGALNGDQTAVITLSEDSTDFVLADLTLTNATATLSGSGTSYTAVLTPVADGPVALSVGVGTFSDAAGNANAVASNEVTTTHDGTAPTVSIAAFTGALNGDQTAVITLSENSTDFVLADLTLTNATATLSGSGTSYTAVLTPIADGPVALSVGVGTFSDAAGNTNAVASNEVTMSYDGTAPVIRPIGNVSFEAGPDGTRLIGFSAIVDDNVDTRIVPVFSLSGDVITSPYAFPLGANLVKINATDSAGNAAVESEFTLTITPGAGPAVPILTTTTINANRSITIAGTTDVDTTVRITFPDASVETVTATGGTFSVTSAADMVGGTVSVTAEDGLGNVSLAATVDLFPDYDVPTVSIAAFTGALNGDQTAVITLSEDSTDFVLADLTLTNATATLSGSGTSYTAVLTPVADGPVALSVGVGTFSDAAGNTNAVASNEVTATYDGTAPTVSIAAFTGALNGDQTAVITLSEDSTDFVLADLTLTNATATLSGSGTSYTAVLTPVADGPVALSVGVGTFSDAAGNTNAVASNEVTATYDGTAPTVSIAAFTGALNGDQTAVITLSEDSTDFVLADLTLTNATATLSGSGTSYTAVLTPVADGPVALSVGVGTFSDAAGNTNAVASNEVTATYDGTAPTVSIAAFTGALNGDQTAVITLSEDSTDFVLADLTLTNATATLSGSGTSYTAVLTPVADGPVALSVGVGTFSDAAGNTNAVASNEVTTTYDGTAPTVSIATTTTHFSGAGTFDVAATFSEEVMGFDANDIAVTNGSVTNVTGSGADYVATIAATGSGDVEISVPAGTAVDAAGNASLASNTLSISSATVAETQTVIAQFMYTRSNQLISSQPNLTGFLLADGAGRFDASVTRGAGSFSFARAPDASTPVWVNLNASWTDEDVRETQYVFGAAGSHFAFSPNLLVGGMIEMDYLSQEDGTAQVEGRGWLVGPYFVARTPNHPLFIDGRLLYGKTSNDVSPLGTYTDRFESERVLAQFKVSGELVYSATTLIPSLQLSYTTDDQKAYVDSLDNKIPAQGIELGQAELGMDFRHVLQLADSVKTIELAGGLAAIGSSTRGSGNADLIVPEYEGARAKLKLGLNYTMANGGTFSVDTFYDGIGARGYESLGLQARYNLTF
ncbi:Ig-like domain-containing protein [Yoonia maritima]|uniref:Ig-like domain-containing protein n=1 Tax=Yoonia maritima TaxID=1435347 RepID=UPI0037363854